MAVIETGPLTIAASSVAQGKSTLIMKAGGSSLAQTGASGRVIAILKTAGQSAAKVVAQIPNNSVVIKYTKGTSIAKAVAQGGDFTKYKTVAGVSSTSAKVELYRTDRDIQRDVADYLPTFYRDFPQVVEHMRTLANESTRVQAKVNEILDQFYVDTATVALDRWEHLAEIDWIPERSEVSRRHFIKSKLRGTGTVTRALLNEIADAFYECEVMELPAEYAVNFKLIGKRGIPRNLEDIQATVSDVIPAHIEPKYEFTYLPWSEVSAAGLTWTQADEYTAKGLEEAFLIE